MTIPLQSYISILSKFDLLNIINYQHFRREFRERIRKSSEINFRPNFENMINSTKFSFLIFRIYVINFSVMHNLKCLKYNECNISIFSISPKR